MPWCQGSTRSFFDPRVSAFYDLSVIDCAIASDEPELLCLFLDIRHSGFFPLQCLLLEIRHTGSFPLHGLKQCIPWIPTSQMGKGSYTSRAGQAGEGSFKREQTISQRRNLLNRVTNQCNAKTVVFVRAILEPFRLVVARWMRWCKKSRDVVWWGVRKNVM